MNYKELKQKNTTELTKLLQETQARLQTLRFQSATKRLTNVREIRQCRTTIARILTALTQTNHD
ncbi:MAG: 50S ribosomal protein L29 [Patescibacteria group bacterium]|jgi:ribosomal protein L29